MNKILKYTILTSILSNCTLLFAELSERDKLIIANQNNPYSNIIINNPNQQTLISPVPGVYVNVPKIAKDTYNVIKKDINTNPKKEEDLDEIEARKKVEENNNKMLEAQKKQSENIENSSKSNEKNVQNNKDINNQNSNTKITQNKPSNKPNNEQIVLNNLSNYNTSDQIDLEKKSKEKMTQQYIDFLKTTSNYPYTNK